MPAHSPTLASLAKEARAELERRLLERQSGRCFICDEPLDLLLHLEQLESQAPLEHLPVDLELQRGKPRWLHAIDRARGGLVREGFIEKRGKQWRITAAGRQAAEAGAKKAQG